MFIEFFFFFCFLKGNQIMRSIILSFHRCTLNTEGAWDNFIGTDKERSAYCKSILFGGVPQPLFQIAVPRSFPGTGIHSYFMRNVYFTLPYPRTVFSSSVIILLR